MCSWAWTLGGRRRGVPLRGICLCVLILTLGVDVDLRCEM